MSCWRTYTCDVLKNVDKGIVIEALKNMGLGLDEDAKRVYGVFEGRNSICDAVLTKDGKRISMGVLFDDGTGHLMLVPGSTARCFRTSFRAPTSASM